MSLDPRLGYMAATSRSRPPIHGKLRSESRRAAAQICGAPCEAFLKRDARLPTKQLPVQGMARWRYFGLLSGSGADHCMIFDREPTWSTDYLSELEDCERARVASIDRSGGSS